MPWGLVFYNDTVFGPGTHTLLSDVQADNNIVILAQQIMAKQAQGVGIQTVFVEHNQLYFQLTDHTYQGPFTLQATSLPTPTPHTLGGVNSYGPVVHQFITQINTDGSIESAQPEFDDLLGTLSSSQLPTPTPHTLGAVESHAAISHQFITQIGTDGTITSAQPAFTDISGTVAAAQLPNPTSTTLGGVESIAAVTHNFLTSISTSGVPAAAQPAFTDISGVPSAAQVRPTTVTALGTTGTVSLDPTLGNIFTVTPTGAITLNAASTPAGAEITLIITTSGTSSFNITPTTNFISQGALATGTVTAKHWVMKFACDGTNFYEVSRSPAAM